MSTIAKSGSLMNSDILFMKTKNLKFSRIIIKSDINAEDNFGIIFISNELFIRIVNLKMLRF